MSLNPSPTPPLTHLKEAAAKRCPEGCPHATCLLGRLTPLLERFTAATPGPWRWMGYASQRELHLATTHSGHFHIMDFARWGGQSAQPRFHPRGKPMVAAEHLFELDHRGRAILGVRNPDAIFLEHSWEDVDELLKIVAELLQPPA